MGAVNTLQVSPIQAVGKTMVWSLRFLILIVLYFILFALGGGLVAPYLPAAPAEPGPVPEMTALLIVCAATVLIIMSTIHSSPGDARPFFPQMLHIFTTDPWLTPYQLLRTLIWVAGAYPIIRGSRLPLWQTALIVGLALSVPQNIGNILPNSLIPLNSVRMSHLIETASSTFVFGLIITWLLYPKYTNKGSYSG